MGIPVSDVELANLGLIYIGEARISSIESPTDDRERLVALVYDQTRQELLREIPWNFAKRRKYIAKLEESPEFEYASAYELPADFIRLLWIGEDEAQRARWQSAQYDIQGRQILTFESDATLPICYIRDVTDVTHMDPLFRNVLAIKLGLKLARAFTKSKSVVEELNSLLAIEMPSAASVDGQERPPIKIDNSNIMTARRRGSRSGASPWIGEF